jgi:hypothetical protein
MATAKKTEDKVTEPVTVSFDIPNVEADDKPPVSTPSMDDFAPVVPPPRKAVRSSKRTTVDQEVERLRTELDRNFSIIAIAICMRDAWDGQLILLNKDTVIDSWMEVAKVNPKFRQALLKLMDVGVYATAISNSLAMAVAVLAHHSMTPNPEMVMTAVSYTGLKMPTDEQVAQMEAMFDIFEDAPETANVNGNGSS